MCFLLFLTKSESDLSLSNGSKQCYFEALRGCQFSIRSTRMQHSLLTRTFSLFAIFMPLPCPCGLVTAQLLCQDPGAPVADLRGTTDRNGPGCWRVSWGVYRSTSTNQQSDEFLDMSSRFGHTQRRLLVQYDLEVCGQRNMIAQIIRIKFKVSIS